VPSGSIGELYFRRAGAAEVNPYVGAPAPRRRAGGFTTFGDLGWLDEHGYVYLSDRRTDMIVTGGVNVYPAEVEAALLDHAAVADVAVIGLPDDEWGRRVHAVLEPAPGHPLPADDELVALCRARLSRQKVPKAFEWVDALPRDQAGKLRRSALADERIDS